MSSRAKGTLLGAGLGAATALFVTSEYARSSRVYWALGDWVNAGIRLFDPETSHGLAVAGMRSKLNAVAAHRTSSLLKTTVWGLTFDNPVGMAAGFDKQATAFESLFDLGYGFVEVGGVTPLPQPGNPKPRMWRLSEDKAVINRLGLNSEGFAVVAPRLARRVPTPGRVLGVNIAKNTDSKDSIGDYCQGVKTLGPLVDFIVVNVSCPNVQSIKDMKSDEMFRLVSSVRVERDKTCPNTPLLLKVGPDMTDEGKAKMAALAIECGVDGLVVSNTTSFRDGLSEWVRQKRRWSQPLPLLQSPLISDTRG